MGGFEWTLWGVLTVINVGALYFHRKWIDKVQNLLNECKRLVNGPWKQAARVETIKAVLDGMTDAKNHFITATGSSPTDLVVRVFDDMILNVSDIYMREQDRLEEEIEADAATADK